MKFEVGQLVKDVQINSPKMRIRFVSEQEVSCYWFNNHTYCEKVFPISFLTEVDEIEFKD